MTLRRMADGHGTLALLGCFFVAMFENDPEADPVVVARQRLVRVQSCVDLMGHIIGETIRGTPAYDVALAWLEDFERSRFCRVLELELLLKERRDQMRLPPPNSPWRST